MTVLLGFSISAKSAHAVGCDINSIQSFTTSPTAGQAGDTVTISWVVKPGCTDGVLELTSGLVVFASQPSGSYTYTLSGPPETYYLHVCDGAKPGPTFGKCGVPYFNSGMVDDDFAQVTVGALPPSPATLNVSVVDENNNPLSGATWNVSGGSPSPSPSSGSGTSVSHSVYPSSGGSSITVSGYPSFIGSRTNLTVTSTDSGNTQFMSPGSTKWVQLKYSLPPVTDCTINTFNASPSSIALGGSSLLTWTSSNMISSTGTNFNSNGDTQNTTGVSVSPLVTTTYTLTGTGGAGCNKSVTVTVTSIQPPILSGVTGSCGGNVNLSWNSVSGATSYKVYRDGVFVTSTGSTSYTDTVSVSSTHSYTVRASNGSADSVDSNTVIVTASAACGPATPILTATPAACGTGTINLSWNSVSGATSYGIRDNGILIYNSSGTSFSHTGLVAGSSHSYVIFASNGVTLSPDSAPVVATAPANCILPTPSSFTATPAGCGTGAITLNWGSSAGATGYRLFRNSVQIQFTSGFSFFDTGLNAGQTYTYDLYATNGAINSATLTLNATAPINCPAQPDITAAAPTPSSATAGTPLTFNANITNNGSVSTGSGFNNQFQVATGANGTGVVSIISTNSIVALAGSMTGFVNSSSYTFPSAGTYSVRVCADIDGVIAESNESNNCSGWTNVTVVATPSTPTGLTATPSSCGTGTINVTWNAVSGATSYSLRDGASVIYTNSAASFSHTGLVAGSSHSYTVLATNAAGSSAYSAAVAALAPSGCAQSDLSASAPTPSTATAGTPLTFSSTISNVGGASTGASFNNLFQVATASNGGGAVSALSTNSIGALGASASGVVTSSAYTFGSAGTFSVRTCADADASFIGTITESNEGNNCGGWTDVTVSAPLPVPVVTLTASPVSGTVNVVNPQLTWNATNSATSCTASGDWSGAKAVSGNNVPQGVLSVVKTYTYTLTCSNASGASAPVSATVVVNAASGPDLTAGVTSPTTATTGTPLTFSGSISNPGSASTGSSFNNLFQVSTASNGSGVISTLSVNSLGALGSGSSGAITSSGYTFGSSGTYSVRLCADADNLMLGTIAESNEGNNCGGWTDVTVSAPLPVPVVTLTASPVSGTVNVVNPQLTWNATNSATSCTASGDWSGAKAVSGNNVPQGVLSVVKTYTYTLTCSNASGASAPVSATVVVNAASGPDLTVTVDPAPTTATAGVSQTYSATIKNIGTSSTGVSFNNFFRTSTGPNGTGIVSTISVNTLARLSANASGVVTSSSYSFAVAGTYYVQVCADNNASMVGTIAESNEGNNCGSWVAVTVSAPLPVPVVTLTASPVSGTVNVVNPQLTWNATNSATSCTASGDWSGAKAVSGNNVPQGVLSVVKTYTYTLTCSNASGASAPVSATVTVTAASAPDLTAGVTSPTTATAGSALTFSGTVSNIGTASTGAGFNNFFQVATASSGGGTITDLTSSAMATLVSSGSNTAVSPNYTFPSSGTYSVRLCADKTSSAGGGVITESDETNNCGAWTDVSVASAPVAFNYSLANSGDVVVTKTSGTVNAQNTITETLLAGTTQPVTISVSGQPSGVSVSYSGNPCNPTCGTPTVQFAVSPSATTGTFLITVTGTSAGTPDKTTTFNLTINPSAAYTGTMTVNPTSAYIGQQVVWTCSVSGGTAPYTYTWIGTDFPSNPTGNTVSITYQSVGVKTASASVQDALGSVTSCASKTVQININPNFKEF